MYRKHSVKIDLTKVNKDKIGIVRIRVFCNNSSIELYPKLSLKTSQWNKGKERVKQGCVVGGVMYNALNSMLDEQVAFVNCFFNECVLLKAEPSLKELRQKFNFKFKSEHKEDDGFFYMYHKFIETTQRTNNWGEEALEVYTRLSKQLEAYCPNLDFSDLSEEFMNGFVTYLSKTMLNEAIKKRLSYLNQFISWAKSKGRVVNREYDTYKPKLKKSQIAVKFLTREEVYKIANLDLEFGSPMDMTRDFFIFQCFSALRYSDLKRLKKENISQRQDGRYELAIVTKKDNGAIHFKLSKVAERIYLKYKHNEYQGDVLFPVLSNQKYNEHLKELGKLAELEGCWIDYRYRLNHQECEYTPKTDLTTHIPRRTFVCLALNAGVSDTLVSQITSHSDVAAMKPYMKITTEGLDRVIDTVDTDTIDIP